MHVDVVDLSPKFLAFYNEAIEQNLQADARRDMWRSMYGVAAVPPTPEGTRMAGQLLEAAWDKYPVVLERIKAGAEGMRPSPEPVCRRVMYTLAYDGPLHVRLVAFVGCIEDNAFAYRDGDTT